MNRPPRFIYLLNSSQRRLQQYIAQHGNGLSSAQGGVLFLLEREDGSLMGHLAQVLDLAPSAISGLIDRMQKAGLVTRRPCPVDGRAQRRSEERRVGAEGRARTSGLNSDVE